MTTESASNSTRIFKGILCALLGMLCAISFSVTPDVYRGLGAVPAATTSYLWTALALCFGLMFWVCFARLSLRLCPRDIIAGLLFGLANAFCSELFAADSWQMSRLRLLLTFVKALGQSLPMMCAITLLHHWLTKKRVSPAPYGKLLTRADSVLRVHPVFPLFLMLILCWLPYLIIFYPGTVCWDLGSMVASFFGMREWDTLHPVFVTLLLGGLVWFGRLFGSDNLGPLLYTLLQTALLAWALASAVAFCRRLFPKRRGWAAMLAFFALTPLFGGYAQYICSDTMYTAAIVLFVLSTLKLVLFQDTNARRESIMLLLCGLLCCLMRPTGLYLIAVTSLAVAALLLRRSGGIRQRLFPIVCMASAVLLTILFNQIAVSTLNVKDNSASAVYSVCFQQSARLMRDRAADVTQEEYNAIDAVLPAEKLPSLYDPAVCDPVKYSFRQWGQGRESEQNALNEYFPAWLKMAKKYPLTTLESFFAGNMSYFTFQPKIDGETYNNQGGVRLVFETYDLGEDARFLHTRQPNLFYTARILLAAFARGWRHIPGLSMLYCCAFYTWTAIAATISLLRQKRGRLLCCFLPILFTMFMCVGSQVNDYFRYFLPIAALLPLLLCAAASPEEVSGKV